MGVCNCSMFCCTCTLLYVHSSIAIILLGNRELVALLNLSSWCLVMVERLLLAVPWGCLRFVILVFADHTHLLFFKLKSGHGYCHRQTDREADRETDGRPGTNNKSPKPKGGDIFKVRTTIKRRLI